MGSLSNLRFLDLALFEYELCDTKLNVLKLSVRFKFLVDLIEET